jgi:uncharacterized membrane protein
MGGQGDRGGDLYSAGGGRAGGGQTAEDAQPYGSWALLARLVFGGLVGAVAATGVEGSAFAGISLGALGALLGAFGGYLVRRFLVLWTGRPDWNLAVIEDASAVVIAIFALGVITG